MPEETDRLNSIPGRTELVFEGWALVETLEALDEAAVNVAARPNFLTRQRLRAAVRVGRVALFAAPAPARR